VLKELSQTEEEHCFSAVFGLFCVCFVLKELSQTEEEHCFSAVFGLCCVVLC